MITEELRHKAVARTMKAITPAEHQKNVDFFLKLLNRINDEDLSEKFSSEIEELDSFYDDYIFHISELRGILQKYHLKTADLRDIYKLRKK